MIDRSNTTPFGKYNTTQKFELWDGWFFDGSLIRDVAGNHYSEEDIRLSWLSNHVVNNWRGSSGASITSLKMNLQHKIALTQVPTICLIYETPDGIIEKVFKLTEQP